ncbi:MAG: hypothetical protein KGD58_17745 [Candidatus Lokiarchaeota archaeon]|nr:hypothetical protein [Candidatus Lokiarchaeota archaeon]
MLERKYKIRIIILLILGIPCGIVGLLFFGLMSHDLDLPGAIVWLGFLIGLFVPAGIYLVILAIVDELRKLGL